MQTTNRLGALAAAAGAIVAMGLLVLMLVLVEARPVWATLPGPNGKIAFSGFDSQEISIHREFIASCYLASSSYGAERLFVEDLARSGPRPGGMWNRRRRKVGQRAPT